MKFARCLTLSIVFLAAVHMCIGQDYSSFVRNMFEDADRVESVRHLSGTINGVHDVDLWLGSMGGSYRGVMSMNNDSLLFELIGNVEGENIVLQEVDSRGQVTGYVRGELGLDRFEGRWWSADVSRSAELRLREKGLILLEKFEPSLVMYDGNFGSEEFSMWLWYEAQDLVSGIVFTDSLCTRVFGTCKDEFCREVNVEITVGSFDNAQMTRRAKKEWDVVMRDMNGARRGTMTETYRYDIYRGGKVNYTFLADYSYPLIEEGQFTPWIQQKMEQWYASYQRDDSIALKADDAARWSDFASAWVDIFLMEDDLISGIITQTVPGSQTYTRVPFVFDTGAGREVEMTELVKRDEDLIGALRATLTAGDPVAYQYPVLTENGFALCTDFDAVAGDSIQIVPYEMVNPVLRKKAVFTKLAD